MPIQNRHSIRDIGAITAGSNSGTLTMDEAISALLHLEGSGAVVTIEASPDGGTTWAPLFDDVSGTPTAWSRTVPAAGGCYAIPFMPKTFRVAVATANATSVFIEGLRDI